MAVNDFARRMLGFDPLAMFGAGGDQPVAGPQANAATVAQPTLDQLYDQDLSRARMDRVGNLGMMLMAASGQLTPAQRATILAQAPAYMDGAERDAMTAAQARLYGMRGRAEQDEAARVEQRRQALMDPAFLKSHNIDPRLAQAVGADGVSSILQSQMAANTPEAQLNRRIKEAELQNATGPKIGPIGQDADGNTIYGDQRTGRPLNMPMTPQQPSTTQGEMPPNVNPREFRKQQAKNAADAEAAARQRQEYEETQFKPALMDYDAAVREGIKGGAFGPLQANETWRSITSNSQSEALRQRIEQAEKRMAFELAKRASGGKLDSKGLTDTELEQYRKQLIPLYASNPQMLLDSFEKNYGIQPQATPQSGRLPQGVTIRRLGD